MSDVEWRDNCPIKKHRRRRGMTQAALASAARCSVSQVAAWERGDCVPRWQNIVALAVSMGCEPAKLIGALHGWHSRRMVS